TRIEDEAAAFGTPARLPRWGPRLPRILNRPAGERARDLSDVLLRVPAVDAERVQLHQLAPVILIQTLRRVLALRQRPRAHDAAPIHLHLPGRDVRTVWTSAHPVIEIEQHRWALRGCFEQIAKL